MLRTRFTYLITLAGVLAFFVCFNGYLSSYVLIAALLLPVLSLILSVLCLFGIRIVLSPLPYSSEKGEKLPVTVTVRNRLPLTSGQVSVVLTVKNTLTGEEQKERLTFLAGPKPLTVFHNVTSSCCGQLVVTLKKGRLFDYLGLLALPLKLSKRTSTLFYPSVRKPLLAVEQALLPDSEGEQYSPKTPGHDPSELFGLREYREGDRIAQIHWKLSVKTGETMVREYSLPISDSLLFLLSPNVSGRTAGMLLDTFATLSGFLAENGIPHRVSFRDENGAFLLREITDRDKLYEVLGEILSAGSVPGVISPDRLSLPGGVSHFLYLCCFPEEQLIHYLCDRTPSARLSVFTAENSANSGLELPDNSELIELKKEDITESLNGFLL